MDRPSPANSGLMTGGINVRPVRLHKARRRAQSGEAEFSVEVMGITRRQHHPPESLNVRMGEQGLEHFSRHAFSPMLGENKDIGQVCECGPIRHQTRKTNLSAADKSSHA